MVGGTEFSGGGISPQEMRRQETREPTSHRERVNASREFKRVLGEYKTNVNAAVDSGLIQGDIADRLVSLRAQDTKRTQLRKDSQSTTDVDQAIAQESKTVYKWFQENFGGATTVLDEYASDNHAPLHEIVSLSVAHLVGARGDTTRRDQLQNTSMQQMASFLLENAPIFTPVKEVLHKENLSFDASLWEDNEQILDTVTAVARADEELALLSPDAAEEALKTWMGQMGREARSGVQAKNGELKRRKVYETPHYTKLLDEVERMGKRRNGVGGVVLYGPPGTGKTELIQEKNRREGFDTHVISMHEYTSFSDLLAEKAVTVAGESGAGLAQKLQIVTGEIASTPVHEFRNAMTEIFEELQATGKVDGDISSFLLPYVSLQKHGIIDSLAKQDFSDTDWSTIQSAFLDKQKARMLRTVLNPSQQESPEDIVRGEILLAIKRSRDSGKKIRILLDEIDKAGPGSFGGLLTVLAKSPGESITIGGTTETIPLWFTVDATTNEPSLNPYLNDRFSGLEVPTPPVKDQMMIAAVRLSDQEGTNKLSTYEQEQLAVFFMHILPKVNEILVAQKKPPLSNRSIQELTSNLVDFTNMQRTGMSVGEAVRRLVIENRPWKNDSAVAEPLQKIIHEQFAVALADPKIAIKTRNRQQAPIIALSKKSTVFMDAINGLIENESMSTGTIEEVFLDEQQQTLVVQAVTSEKEVASRQRDNFRRLTTGQTISVQEKDGRFIFHLYGVPKGEVSQPLFQQQIATMPGSVVAASGDGKVIGIVSQDDQKQRLQIVHPFEEGKTSEALSLPPGIITIDQAGKFVGHLDETTGRLSVRNANEINRERKERVLNKVVSYTFSPDGSMILTKGRNGATMLFSSDTLQSVATEALATPEEGYEWKFVGTNLLIQIAQNGTQVKESALYVT